MEHFQIETAQNIHITQQAARIRDRILAYLIDAFILGSYVLIVVFSFLALQIDLQKLWGIQMLLMIPFVFYDLLCELLANGQTIGKRVMQLKVVKMDGSHPTFGNLVVRWLMRLVDITITSGGLAIFTILINGKGQRLGDIAAGTTVISTRKKIKLSDTLLRELPEDYQPTFSEVSLFKDSEIQLIKELYDKALIERDYKIINSLSDQIKQVTAIKTDLKPIVFVDLIIKDYNYFTQKM